MQNWPFFIGIAIGLYIIWGASAKTDTKPYYWLHKRAEVLFKSRAHTFLSFSGGMVVGAMIFFINL
jgi:hypothetical protein